MEDVLRRSLTFDEYDAQLIYDALCNSIYMLNEAVNMETNEELKRTGKYNISRLEELNKKFSELKWWKI